MKESIRQFLEFEGHEMHFTYVNSTWWIAIKPICQALKVNYDRQQKNLKSDKILGSVYAVQHIQVPGDQGRKMICLPEFHIYGWLFSIKSESERLTEYKWKCYELLYNYFHGTITQRNKFLIEKVSLDRAIESHKKLLLQMDSYMELKTLESKRLHTKKALDKLDQDIISAQTSMFTEA